MSLFWWTDNPITLNMEETFIVTGIAIVVLGVVLGLFVSWAFEKENSKEEDDDGLS
jgi:hypothetical protein